MTEISLPEKGLTARMAAFKLETTVSELAKQLREMGEGEVAKVILTNEKNLVDSDLIELIALEKGWSVKRILEKAVEEPLDQAALLAQRKANLNEANLTRRFPIVSVMGHVDHGKTTLLDNLRSRANRQRIAATEAGGITQKLSAFTVQEKEESKVIFIDTPGHAAFSMMRGQGALATDIVILVVAIDDGVQPQTLEALQCAQRSKCTIILAINKVDKLPNKQDRESQKRQIQLELSKHDLLTEEFGGDVQVVEISAKTGKGIDELIDSLSVQSEVLDLKADPNGFVEAFVLDSRMEKGRGIVVEALVREGSLKVGDSVVVGTTVGKVRSIFDEEEKSIKLAPPSSLVKIIGFKELPESGIELLSVESESQAKAIAERRQKLKEMRTANDTTIIYSKSKKDRAAEAEKKKELKKMSKFEIFREFKRRAEEERAKKQSMNDGPERKPTIALLLKADAAGTLDALGKIVEDIRVKVQEHVDLKVMSRSIGEVTVGDFALCQDNEEAVILAFNVSGGDARARAHSKQFEVPIYSDNIIYNLEDSLVERVESLLPKDRILQKEVTPLHRLCV